MGDGAFASCTGIETAYVPTTAMVFPTGNLKTIILHSGTKIKDGALRGADKLVSVTLPDSITEIGNYAFYGCSSFASIKLPTGLKSIGEYAFSGCLSLTSIEIPKSMMKIDNYAFFGCKKLAAATFLQPVAWRHAYGKTATISKPFPEADIANPTTAAKYLTNTYAEFYWTCHLSE